MFLTNEKKMLKNFVQDSSLAQVKSVVRVTRKPNYFFRPYFSDVGIIGKWEK